MKKIGIFYGSTGGKTAAIVDEIEFYLRKDEHEVHNIKDGIDSMSSYENLILVTPTYGVGELQEDWEKVLPTFEKMNFSGKKIGIAGLGNQLAFGESFVGGMRILYDAVLKNNGTVLGMTSSQGYRHKESEAEINGMFVGLALDESNADDETPDKIAAWIKELKKNFN